MLLLDRKTVASLLPLPECIRAVEEAFRSHAEGRSLSPAVAAVGADGGAFHVKAAGLKLSRLYFAAKTNANFPGNPDHFGLPAIQGVVLLADAQNGRPLALLDSIEITIRRTGAATAVAARFLARPDSKVATICGCGNQGRVQLEALAGVLPLESAFAYDVSFERAERFAAEVSASLGLDVRATRDLACVRESDVCVTCTPSRSPFLFAGDLSAGAFLAAVGADGPEKQELDPKLLAQSKVVVDLVDQCAEFGELHHALEAGEMTREQVHADLAGVVAGRRPGRRNRGETFIFDSTGTALQDVAAAALVYEKALAAGIGHEWEPAA